MDDRGKIGGAGRVGLIVDELDPVLLDEVADALGGVLRELGVFGEQGERFGFGFAAIATWKKGSAKACFGSGPAGSIEKYFG